MDSQSNLIGIETSNESPLEWRFGLSIEPYWNWNSRPRILRTRQEFLSIEPYWNWNNSNQCLCFARLASQSNLIGIETSSQQHKAIFWYFSQSNLIGIETRNSTSRSGTGTLSIEPYWNWNWLRGECLGQSSLTLNRTLLELKPDPASVVLTSE